MLKLHHFAAPTAEELEAEINRYKKSHPTLTETKRMEEHYPDTKSPYQAGVLFEKSDFQNERENYSDHGTILDEEELDEMTRGWKLAWWERIILTIVLFGIVVLATIQLVFKILETVIVTPIFWLFDKIK